MIKLSRTEQEHTQKLDESIRLGEMKSEHIDAFINCSIASLLQHAINMTSYQDVEHLLKSLGGDDSNDE